MGPISQMAVISCTPWLQENFENGGTGTGLDSDMLVQDHLILSHESGARALTITTITDVSLLCRRNRGEGKPVEAEAKDRDASRANCELGRPAIAYYA